MDQSNNLENDLFEHYQFKADKGQEPLRVDKFLMNRIENSTRNKIQTAAKNGAIYSNDKIVKSNYKVKPGDVVRVMFSHPPYENLLVGEEMNLDIIHEDKNLLVVNKPAGLVVHPGHGNYNGTLLNGLINHFENLPQNKDGRPGLVHRIDKDTSGLLVVAKSDSAHAGLAKQFADHSISRRYLAVSKGVPQKSDPRLAGLRGVNFEDGGVIRVATNIARHKTDRKRMAVVQDAGRHAITRATVLENFAHSALMECWLETGRTHQIRVHFSHIGHGLIGDPIYGLRKAMPGSVFEPEDMVIVKGFSRQALHAKSIGFIHPITKEYMNFDSDIPSDLIELIEILRKK